VKFVGACVFCGLLISLLSSSTTLKKSRELTEIRNFPITRKSDCFPNPVVHPHLPISVANLNDYRIEHLQGPGRVHSCYHTWSSLLRVASTTPAPYFESHTSSSLPRRVPRTDLYQNGK